MNRNQKKRILALVRQAAENVVRVTSWTKADEKEFHQSTQDALYEQAFLLIKAIGLLQ
jgi:hypothetical protein